jgi:hypothetical protein
MGVLFVDGVWCCFERGGDLICFTSWKGSKESGDYQDLDITRQRDLHLGAFWWHNP